MPGSKPKSVCKNQPKQLALPLRAPRVLLPFAWQQRSLAQLILKADLPRSCQSS